MPPLGGPRDMTADSALVGAAVMTAGTRPSRSTPLPRNPHVRAAVLQKRLRPLHRRLDLISTAGAPRTLAQAVQENAGATSASYAGLWRKNPDASDPMDAACDAVELGWVLRRAIGLLNQMQVVDTPDTFGTTIKAGGVLDVVERYPKSGESVVHKRRDKRGGSHTGVVVQTAEGPSIQVEWSEPYAGWCSDTFTLSEGGRRLTVSTLMRMSSGREVSYKTVYQRAGGAAAA
mmetsp:Transcript_47411/g.119998  ORF Transcript_47411/g.119998 Transcript_47411/m.119998 type:complete len:232 (-) Transcript_47411:47-742(-)|eukprot:jgi/Tetstr1/435777/TSEL_024668.t1